MVRLPAPRTYTCTEALAAVYPLHSRPYFFLSCLSGLTSRPASSLSLSARLSPWVLDPAVTAHPPLHPPCQAPAPPPPSSPPLPPSASPPAPPSTFFSLFGCPAASGVPRPGIRSELRLRPKPQRQERQILNALCQARNRTCVPGLPRRHQSCCTTGGGGPPSLSFCAALLSLLSRLPLSSQLFERRGGLVLVFVCPHPLVPLSGLLPLSGASILLPLQFIALPRPRPWPLDPRNTPPQDVQLRV